VKGTANLPMNIRIEVLFNTIFGPSLIFPSKLRYYLSGISCKKSFLIEQNALKNVNICLNTNIYSYLETSGGQSSHLYLNFAHFYNTSVNQTSVAA
jgi:hypothetical protein